MTGFNRRTAMVRVIQPSQDRPWQTWVTGLGFPRRYDPLEAEIEHAVEDAILHAIDADWPWPPGSISAMWAAFRKHHVALGGRWKYRRKRFLIWRAAALKTMVDRGYYQDAVDAEMIRDKLLATYREFGPLDIDGSYGPYSLWRPESPLEEYAADVLALFSIVMPMAVMRAHRQSLLTVRAPRDTVKAAVSAALSELHPQA